MDLGALLLLSLCCLHSVRAESEPIPVDMYEKIRRTSIKSIMDLRRILQIDSVDTEESVNYASRNETNNLPRANSSPSRVIRSLDVEMATIAECKTRTEVFEISRQLVDSTNANFIIHPACVEVQRCSGCCISQTYKCVPRRVHIRHVKVKKIIFTHSKPKVELVPVPLEDHVECSCEAILSTVARSRHIQLEAKGVSGVPQTTVPPATVSRKEEPSLRASKRKNRKFKHLPSKKEQINLLIT
uniref:Platelet-derived growth factor subunit B n=1 Tax=Leptobrachium leishanense TaxID=445787 RepID=A0A8C5Q8P1_9ANUR